MRKTVFGIRPSAQCFILFGFGIGQEFSFRCIPNTNIYECWWSCCFFLDFILAETHRKIFVLLFVDNSMQIFKWFSLQIWEDVCRTYHIVTCLKKIYKNVTEQMTSNSVLAQIFLALWTLNPGAASSCSAVWIHAVRACIRNITFCSLFTNRLRPFCDFNHHSNQHQPPLPLLIGDMRCSAKQSLAVCASCL